MGTNRSCLSFIVMNIYNRSSIIEFYLKHTNAKIPLEIWYDDVVSKKWESPNQLKKDYGGNVSILKNGRAVFDIKANDYRLIAAINYDQGWLFIKFIGTHTEYDKINADTIDSYKPKPKKKTKPSPKKKK